jgi:hypothetical protein
MSCDRSREPEVKRRAETEAARNTAIAAGFDKPGTQVVSTIFGMVNGPAGAAAGAGLNAGVNTAVFFAVNLKNAAEKDI